MKQRKFKAVGWAMKHKDEEKLYQVYASKQTVMRNISLFTWPKDWRSVRIYIEVKN